MAKAVNGCNKKAEEGKSVKEKESVLFEELVRTIYGIRLKVLLSLSKTLIKAHLTRTTWNF